MNSMRAIYANVRVRKTPVDYVVGTLPVLQTIYRAAETRCMKSCLATQSEN